MLEVRRGLFDGIDDGFEDSFELAPMEVRRLSNVAATALMLLGFEAPEDMDAPLIRWA